MAERVTVQCHCCVYMAHVLDASHSLHHQTTCLVWAMRSRLCQPSTPPHMCRRARFGTGEWSKRKPRSRAQCKRYVASRRSIAYRLRNPNPIHTIRATQAAKLQIDLGGFEALIDYCDPTLRVPNPVSLEACIIGLPDMGMRGRDTERQATGVNIKAITPSIVAAHDMAFPVYCVNRIS